MKDVERDRLLFEFYNEVGEKYPANEIAYKNVDAQLREQLVIQLLEESSGLTLDVGCAEGHYKPYIEDYVGFDISLPRLEKLEGRKTWAVAEHFPFKNGVFDRILMSELLEHTWQHKQVLGECHRVLRKGGRMIMSTPHGTNIFHIQKNWSYLERYDVTFNPYVHGRFPEEYTRKILSNANFKIKLLQIITYKEKPRFIVTESVKNG